MTAKLISAWGYQGDAMNLPVADVVVSAEYYVEKMGFAVVEKNDEPVMRVVLERDGIQMALTENGGDPTQDGCAFHTDNVVELRQEFIGNGLEKIGEIKSETHDDGSNFKVFFVVAPDGLCYWFGEKV
ncbi:MAG: VOC family protein [Pyrinomonadaceae bacterium]